MLITKNIGIWMDHSIAYIMEFTTGLITTIIIESKLDGQNHNAGLSNDETKPFYKEKNLQDAFYKNLGEAIHDCKEVILFGPTYAKVKLYNMLRADKRFAKTKIGVTQAENMSAKEQEKFVMDYFSKRFFFNTAF